MRTPSKKKENLFEYDCSLVYVMDEMLSGVNVGIPPSLPFEGVDVGRI